METGRYTVTLERLEELLNAAKTQETVFWEKELVISYKLPNGFTIMGRAACVDPANFNYDIGRQICRDNALNTLWLLEGYLMQQKMHKALTTDICIKSAADNKKQRTLDLSACFEKLVEKYRLFKG